MPMASTIEPKSALTLRCQRAFSPDQYQGRSETMPSAEKLTAKFKAPIAAETRIG